jgi:rhodanese-related sulfurtransferase
MKRFVLFLTFFTAFSSLSFGQNPEGFDEMIEEIYEYTVPYVTADELQKIRKKNPDAIILDSRKKEEYDISHIPGARFVEYKNFKVKSIKDTPKDQPVYIYCSIGYRSERTAEMLQEAGYTQVFNLYGGLFHWGNNGFPMENSKGNAISELHGYNKEWSQWINQNKCLLQPSRLSKK